MSVIESTERQATRSLLENWSENETMRHVPALPWIVRKLDLDLRRRVDTLLFSYRNIPADHPHHIELEAEARLLIKAIERLADAARHVRGNGHPPNDLTQRMGWTINHAVSALNSIDPTVFGRRYPFQTHDRSRAEPLYAALLVVIQHVERLAERLRDVDPDLDERLLEGLVV